MPFGTNLLRAIGLEIVPEDPNGVTRAQLELDWQIKTFPGLQHGLNPLKSWCDRILLLFNDLGRLTTPTDQNQTICSHLDILIISYGAPPADPVSWNRCKDLLKANTAYVAAPSVSLYMQNIKHFACDHVASLKLTKEGQAGKKRGHFKAHCSCRLQVETSSQGELSWWRRISQPQLPRRPLVCRGGFTSRNNARGGHHGAYKDRQNKNRKPEGKTVNFKQNGAHAANAVLPPPSYIPPLSGNTTAQEEHFAFQATYEPTITVKTDNEDKDKDMYNVCPSCEGATLGQDENEIKNIDYKFSAPPRRATANLMRRLCFTTTARTTRSS